MASEEVQLTKIDVFPKGFYFIAIRHGLVSPICCSDGSLLINLFEHDPDYPKPIPVHGYKPVTGEPGSIFVQQVTFQFWPHLPDFNVVPKGENVFVIVNDMTYEYYRHHPNVILIDISGNREPGFYLVGPPLKK
jgi:hypothetical protein